MQKLIKFTQNRVWRTYQGGKLLDQIAGIDPAKDSSFPEDWIGSTVAAKNIGREHIQEGLATVENEQGERVLFNDVLLSNPEFYLGKVDNNHTALDDIPLVKFLDSATRLHFQAHPTREFAQQRLNSNRGKTEAYVILAIREDVTEPYIYAGFQRSPSREQLKQWIETQNIEAIEACFDKIPVKPGDVFLLPGGRPHALGEGILMLEIMEPSDWAVRFEFERCGYVIPEAARFMNRGIETALDVFNFEPVLQKNIDKEFRCEPKILHQDTHGNLLEELIGANKTDCFKVKRANVSERFERHEKGFFIGIVSEGSGSIIFDGQTIELKQWETFFLPAGIVDFCYQSSGKLAILECYPADTNT
ncbi:class I mannose-6-phosphate isomerase [Glaciecola petra]|uniref:Class I mannose-6-phosphate isomerase n=1 Tax=Glaciecola petra TaxID=3075602 RepID=A0ABU2ZL00_9ALTE|nr:class I mannose-6-phosphate isomerase [Aestuariibacter sp. P117]MDT0593296.1 class I mannose-6-phosphate isomerase [Aestuariibacter sp. P117]